MASDYHIRLTVCLVSIAAVASAAPRTPSDPDPDRVTHAAAGREPTTEYPTKQGTAPSSTSAGSGTPLQGQVSSQPRRDPKGKKGISPFWDALHRGDKAATAAQPVEAQTAYESAIALEPQNPVGHLRKGQLLVRLGKLAEADSVYQQVEHLAATDPESMATALFVLADLKERLGQRDAAITAWQKYAAFLRSEPKTKGHPATAVERLKRLKSFAELVIDAKSVSERIQLRIKELDAAAKRKAAKNPNEGK